MIFLLISLLFLIAERIIPMRPEQHMLRKGFFNDLLHFVFNGYLFYLGYSYVTGYIFAAFTTLTRDTAIGDLLNTRALSDWPLAAQFVALFLVQDFMMWATHNLLHRLPFLWTIHKVHHSVETMDWIGNMRYHWGEIIVYNLMLFVPLTVLGAAPSLFIYIGVFNTVIGHFNHSNIKVDLGPLRYLLNSPKMHLWHHDKSGPGSYNKNFAIGLSVWDWMFGTAYYPKPGEAAQPQALGFADIESFPKTFVGQQLYPLSTAWKGRALYTLLALVLATAVPARAQALADLRVDSARRSVTFSGRIYPSGFNAVNSWPHNHHFIVWKDGKSAHNALIRSEVNDLLIQRALESIGGSAGNNLTLDTWEKRADASSREPDRHVKGSEIDVQVSWRGSSLMRAADLLVDRGGRGFLFRLGGHEKFIPSWRSGCVVCLESCPGGRISNARYTMRDHHAGIAVFDVRKEALPIDGTAVTVTLTLRSASTSRGAGS